jgi:hypothetical protein
MMCAQDVPAHRLNQRKDKENGNNLFADRRETIGCKSIGYDHFPRLFSKLGYRNRFNHPHPTVFARCRLRHIELSRSNKDGATRMDVSSEVSAEVDPRPPVVSASI